MAKGERFITNVLCPECGQSGSATWERDECAIVSGRDVGTTLESVSEGFRAGTGGEIYCTNCGVEAISGRTSN
jgi:hypothetical protein